MATTNTFLTSPGPVLVALARNPWGAALKSRIGVSVHSPAAITTPTRIPSLDDIKAVRAGMRDVPTSHLTFALITWRDSLAWEGATLALQAQQLRNSHAI